MKNKIVGGIDLKKVFLSLFGCTLILLAGCSDGVTDDVSVPKHFYSDKENHYSLLIISDKSMRDKDWVDWKDENHIRNVNEISAVWDISLKEAKEEYQFLELKKFPTFVAFGTKSIAFQTHNIEKLIQFLHDQVPASWNT